MEPIEEAIDMFLDACDARGYDVDMAFEMWKRLHELIPDITAEAIIEELNQTRHAPCS